MQENTIVTRLRSFTKKQPPITTYLQPSFAIGSPVSTNRRSTKVNEFQRLSGIIVNENAIPNMTQAQITRKRKADSINESAKRLKAAIYNDLELYSPACLFEKRNLKIEKMRYNIREFLENSDCELKHWYSVTIATRNWLNEKPRHHFTTKKDHESPSNVKTISLLQSKENCIFNSLCEELLERFGNSNIKYGLIVKERSEKDTFTFLVGSNIEQPQFVSNPSSLFPEFFIEKCFKIPKEDVPHVILYFCKRDTASNKAVISNNCKFAELINKKYKELAISNLKIDYDDYFKHGDIIPIKIEHNDDF